MAKLTALVDAKNNRLTLNVLAFLGTPQLINRVGSG
jgi:hypothetical protein